MEYSYELLLMLRHHTTLGIVPRIKIADEEDRALETAEMIGKLENCRVPVDYHDTEVLEFNYRMRQWQNKMTGLYAQYGKGQDFFDFCLGVLKQEEERRLAKIRKRKLQRVKKR